MMKRREGDSLVRSLFRRVRASVHGHGSFACRLAAAAGLRAQTETSFTSRAGATQSQARIRPAFCSEMSHARAWFRTHVVGLDRKVFYV